MQLRQLLQLRRQVRRRQRRRSGLGLLGLRIGQTLLVGLLLRGLHLLLGGRVLLSVLLSVLLLLMM